MKSSSGTDPQILEILLKVIAKDLGEEALYSSYKSVLGILLRGGLTFALGPVGYALPVSDLVAWLTKISIKTAAEIREARVSGVTYNVHTTGSGLLIAETNNSAALQSLPFHLPEYLELSRNDLFDWKTSPVSATPELNPSGLYRIDPVQVFQPLNNPLICLECGQSVYSHAFSCSQNQLKATTPNEPPFTLSQSLNPNATSSWASLNFICPECNQPTNNHAPLCPRNFNQWTSALSPSSFNLGSSSSFNPSVQVNFNCDECHQNIYNHAWSCSKNSNPAGHFEWVQQNHNRWRDGEYVFEIRFKFRVRNVRNTACGVAAYFDDASGEKLRDYNQRYYTSEGYVTVWEPFTPGYDDSEYKDFKLYIPYSEFHLASGHHSLRFYLSIYVDASNNHFVSSEYFTFTVNQ